MSDDRDNQDGKKPPRGGDPERVDVSEFQKVALEMAKRAPSKAEIEKIAGASNEDTREANLSQSNIVGAITSEDWRWIVKDAIPYHTHALDAVQRWFLVRAEEGRRARTMQALLGQTGRGKTLAAAWLLARMGGAYVTAERMRRLMASYVPRHQNDFEKLAATRVLVIDDVGFELDAPSAAGTLFEIVNHRQGLANGWTIITGNLSVGDFSDRYGERTIRRLEHQGEIVEVIGEDLRRKGRRADDPDPESEP